MARHRVVNGVRRFTSGNFSTSFGSRVARYLRDRRGAVAIIYAAVLPGLVGLVGLGVETGYWYVSKRNLQTEADAAALGGAWSKLYGGSSGAILAAATNEAGRNGFVDTPATDISMNNPPVYGAYIADANAVEIILTEDHELLFASVVRDAVVTVAARAVAKIIPADDACVLALNTTAPDALNITGNTDFNMPTCVLASNSTNCPSGANIDGSATVIAYSVYSAGCYENTSSDPVTLTEPAQTNMAPIIDPYANATVPPAPAPCTPWGGAATKQSGRKYCNNLNIPPPSTVNFEPGIYWLEDANLTVHGTLVCPTCVEGGDGVLIIFMNDSGGDTGSITINGSANVVLNGISPAQAAAAGQPALSGLLLFQDPDAAGDSSDQAHINGGSGTSLTGAIYFPQNEINFEGNTAGQSTCTLIIGKTVDITGNSNMDVTDCGAYGVGVPRSQDVSLVE
ncbi:MAG: pilus assembly protein TadG-related protein [Dongiaceae bacterium]